MYHRKLISLFIILAISYSVQAQSALDIIKKMDENFRGTTSTAEITMTIIRPSWERSVSMKTWSKGLDYTMILITAPARDNGSATLKRKNEIWNWVPNIGRTVKLPPSMMMQSWMGSDFTNDDLIRESSIVFDYNHEIIGDSTIAGYDCYKIQLIPKPDAAVVWGKVIIWVTKTDYLQLKTEYYDEDEYIVNIMRGMNVKEFDGRLLPSKMEMIPVDKPGNKTILEYENMKFNRPISDNFFSVQNMKRLK